MYFILNIAISFFVYKGVMASCFGRALVKRVGRNPFAPIVPDVSNSEPVFLSTIKVKVMPDPPILPHSPKKSHKKSSKKSIKRRSKKSSTEITSGCRTPEIPLSKTPLPLKRMNPFSIEKIENNPLTILSFLSHST